jgi:hypothetical protein
LRLDQQTSHGLDRVFAHADAAGIEVEQETRLFVGRDGEGPTEPEGGQSAGRVPVAVLEPPQVLPLAIGAEPPRNFLEIPDDRVSQSARERVVPAPGRPVDGVSVVRDDLVLGDDAGVQCRQRMRDLERRLRRDAEAATRRWIPPHLADADLVEDEARGRHVTALRAARRGASGHHQETGRDGAGAQRL